MGNQRSGSMIDSCDGNGMTALIAVPGDDEADACFNEPRRDVGPGKGCSSSPFASRAAGVPALRTLESWRCSLEYSKHEKPKMKKAKKLKQFTFDAGNSNSGPAGIVISVEARSEQQATRLANAYLSSFADTIDLPVSAAYKGLGVRYAMCCVAPPSEAQGPRP
jgi:hypothetical protein